MNTRCERQGQTEIGIIEHEGREFAALGASVVGRHVKAYTKLLSGELGLSRLCGSAMLACRSEIVEEYRDGSLTLMFRLTRGNFIVGYALGGEGILFRGELLTGHTNEEARTTARQLADYYAEMDAADEAACASSNAAEECLLDIEYRCPECGHEWQEQWSSACDSECPVCGIKNITALRWEEHQE